VDHVQSLYCGRKVIGAVAATREPRCPPPGVREAVKLKKKAFRASLARGSPEAAALVKDAKTQAWEEFGETMEKDLRLASGRFWQTIQRRMVCGTPKSGQHDPSRGGRASRLGGCDPYPR